MKLHREKRKEVMIWWRLSKDEKNWELSAACERPFREEEALPSSLLIA
jgi:hypothetical protein